METEEHQERTIKYHISLCLKGGSLLLCLLLSTLVIACGASDATTTSILAGPQATFTIRFSNHMSSPVPAIASYLCGAWITDSTPVFKPGNKIPVYAHFIQNVNGNPIGVTGANAQAHVEWADGYRDSAVATTQSDGLAVFYFTIPNRPSMVDRNNLVMVSFTGSHRETCNVDNHPQPAAYFTLINGAPTHETSPGASPPQKQKHRRGG